MLDAGVIGGKMVDGVAQGRTAAAKALDVLRGASVEAVPIDYTSPNLYVFDYNQLRRFHIAIGSLPPGSVVQGKPQTLFQQYPLVASVALVLLMILVVIIIVLSLISRVRFKA